MKRILMFFIGALLLLLSFAAIYFSGALFDAGDKRRIDAFMMQPNNLSADRIGRPVSEDQLSDKFIRERLIRKYVHEYFYITPDAENIARRTQGNSILFRLSERDVFEKWKKSEANTIEALVGKKYMRIVNIKDILLPEGSDYWYVSYELYTWDAPNNIDMMPIKTDGVIYLKIRMWKPNESRIIETLSDGSRFDIKKYLENGGDPAGIFKFKVTEVRK